MAEWVIPRRVIGIVRSTAAAALVVSSSLGVGIHCAHHLLNSPRKQTAKIYIQSVPQTTRTATRIG